jgi:hypothetical protein
MQLSWNSFSFTMGVISGYILYHLASALISWLIWLRKRKIDRERLTNWHERSIKH